MPGCDVPHDLYADEQVHVDLLDEDLNPNVEVIAEMDGIPDEAWEDRQTDMGSYTMRDEEQSAPESDAMFNFLSDVIVTEAARLLNIVMEPVQPPPMQE